VTRLPATRRARRTARVAPSTSVADPFPASRQPVPHLAARSALAGAAVLLPSLDAAWPPEAPRRRSPLRRRLAALIAAGLVVTAVVATFAEVLKVPTVLFGIGLPDENSHAPNEFLSLRNFYDGVAAAAFLYEEIGTGNRG